MNKSNLPPAQKAVMKSVKFGTIVLNEGREVVKPNAENALNNLEKAVKEGVFKADDNTK